MPESNSEKFLKERQFGKPVIDPKIAKGVSQYRRDQLAQEVIAGKFREGNGPYANETPVVVLSGGSGIRKEAGGEAGFSSNLNSSFRTSGSNGTRTLPEIYSPLWLTSNLNLPRDRATVNAWSRAFFALNAMVRNAISLHSTYPISKLNIKHKNPKVEQFFGDMQEEIDLADICVQIAQEYWILGEAFPYAELNESAGKWSRILIQNPDYITVMPSVIPREPNISLRPDDNLKRIVNSSKPSDIEQRQLLNQQIIQHVRRGENIPLPNFNVSHIPFKISPYDIRGTGIIVCIFKALMLWDKYRECKFAQADNLVNPLTLVKIGTAGEFKPGPEVLEQFREAFIQATSDKSWRLFTHDAVDISFPGASGGIVDISNDLDRLVKEIYVGLMVPQVLMDGGSDTSYANGGVALDALKQRYMQFRNMLAYWLRRKIFAPIAKIQGFYDVKDGKKILQIPDIEWNYMSLFDVESHISTLLSMTEGEGHHNRRASRHTLYRSLGMDYDDEMRKVREEMINEAIMEKEAENIKKMALTDLRTLSAKPDTEIKEIEDALVAGEEKSGEEGLAPPEGLPDLSGPPSGSAPPPPAPPKPSPTPPK